MTQISLSAKAVTRPYRFFNAVILSCWWLDSLIDWLMNFKQAGAVVCFIWFAVVMVLRENEKIPKENGPGHMCTSVW